MRVQVSIVGNLPLLIKGLQRQYPDVELPEGAALSDLLRRLNIDRELFALSGGRRLEAGALLADGMEITIVSPASGG